MNDVFSMLYTDIAAHISQNMPEIAWIDLYLGQDQTDLRPALAYPAVLIDFDRADYSMAGGSNQFVEAQISVRLLLDNYASSAQKAPEKSRLAALKNYDIEHRLVSTLHNFQPDRAYVQPLVRTSATSQNRPDIGLKIRVITFTTAWDEDTFRFEN